MRATIYKNESGFGSIQVLLMMVIIGLLGFVGWYVYQAKGKTVATLDNTAKSQGEPQKQELNETKTGQPNLVESPQSPQEEKTTRTQYIGGVPFELSKSVGDLLSWNLTSENSNLSSSTLLAKEKELYGDVTLHCKANDYPLGRVSIKDESTPHPGFSLVKKLESGKYLFYQDDGTSSFCYQSRDKLQGMIKEQIQHIKDGLQTAK